MINEKNDHRKKVIAVLDDLFFSSKIREAAKTLDIELEFVKKPDGFNEKISSEKPSLIIFDLNSRAGDPLEIIKKIKSTGELKQIPVIGFLSHAQIELKEEANRAGCDLVIPRSRFSKDLREILRKYSIPPTES
ncbi:MAG TPA: response regulator [Thermodesulfobacteriota bacterium]|jgi:PleD family two-component response regulator